MEGAASSPLTEARIRWQEDDRECSARWRSEGGVPPPAKVQLADDRMPADVAYRLAAQGAGLLWRGDYHNARHLLDAMARRIDRRQRGRGGRPGADARTAFHQHRQRQGVRARILGNLLLAVEPDHSIALRRAPDARLALREALGAEDERYVISLRALLGAIGAHEWRKRGIPIGALDDNIHPHFGVFAPVRSEYVDLVAEQPLPDPRPESAFDIGTGTGVLAAVLARRGILRVVATDNDPRALACALENRERLGLSPVMEIVHADLFPEGRAGLIVCNPPWIPERPTSPIEQAIYDPDSRMLNGYLNGLRDHLAPGGEGWLILSDIAERLGLRTRDALLGAFEVAGLTVIGRRDTRPSHRKVTDTADLLHAARAAEVTSLWRLAAR